MDAPDRVERRARWVLDTLGGHDLSLGRDLPYVPEAWESVERGELPDDGLAAAFFHLARVEEIRGARDERSRFPAAASCLDPLDPPLERLRTELGLEPPRYVLDGSGGGARFAVALTHDVDNPWRWTRAGIRAAAGRLKRGDLRQAGALALVPIHRLRGTDPYWRFREVLCEEREHGARGSTFFVMARHEHRADGASYADRRQRVVEEILGAGGEVGLHGSYTAAEDLDKLAAEAKEIEGLAGGVAGHRYHYLRIDPHRNLVPLGGLGFRYDTTLGFPDAVGFRAGIAHPFRPWDFEREEPASIVEVPLAVMDATLAEARYQGLTAAAAKPQLIALFDWAAEHGGGFSILWHPDRFDAPTARGWDKLYFELLDAVRERGGVCLPAGELAHSLYDR
jgi:hypothetical protein